MAKTNWGAGLQALGQGLGALAERQMMLRDQERQRQQQLADRNALWAHQQQVTDAERAYNLSLNPMVQLPPETIQQTSTITGPQARGPYATPAMAAYFSIPAAARGISPDLVNTIEKNTLGLSRTNTTSVPNPARAPWMTGGLKQVPQDVYIRENSAWARMGEEARIQAERDARTAAENELDRANRLEVANIAAAARGNTGMTSGAAYNSLLNSQVSDQEVSLRGPGYRAAVGNKYYEFVGSGMAPGAEAMRMAEESVLNEGGFNTLSFPGIVHGQDAANALRYDPASGKFYDSRYYAPDSGVKRFKRDAAPDVALRSDLPYGLESAAALASPLDAASYARSFLLPMLKEGDLGYIKSASAPELIAWANERGIDAATLAKMISDARAVGMFPETNVAQPVEGPFQQFGAAAADGTADQTADWKKLKAMGN